MLKYTTFSFKIKIPTIYVSKKKLTMALPYPFATQPIAQLVDDFEWLDPVI